METTGKPNNASALPHPDRHDACVRCGGLMVVAHYVDLQGHAGEVIIKRPMMSDLSIAEG